MIYDLREKRNGRLGFSFIETVVVIAMIGLMFAGGTMVYSNFSNKKEVDEATSKIISQLEMARSNAKAGILPLGVDQNQANVNNFRYVQVTLTTLGVLNVASNHSLLNVYLTTSIGNVNISPSLTECDVCFSVGEVKLVDSNGIPRESDYLVTINIASKKDIDISRTVFIDSSGMIRRS